MRRLSLIRVFYCKFDIFRDGIIFAELRFVKVKSSRNGENTLSFTDEGKLCHSREFLRRNNVF